LFIVVCVVTAELDDEEYTITGYSSVIGKFWSYFVLIIADLLSFLKVPSSSSYSWSSSLLDFKPLRYGASKVLVDDKIIDSFG
jgi:hypothetical protein